MAINPPAHNAAQAGRPRLRKSLKLWQVVMIGLAYLTPMTVFDTFGIVSGISNGHVPASYLLALAGVLFTAISYGKLVRQFPEAGLYLRAKIHQSARRLYGRLVVAAGLSVSADDQRPAGEDLSLGLVPRSAAVGVGSDLCRYSDRREPEKR